MGIQFHGRLGRLPEKVRRPGPAIKQFLSDSSHRLSAILRSTRDARLRLPSLIFLSTSLRSQTVRPCHEIQGGGQRVPPRLRNQLRILRKSPAAVGGVPPNHPPHRRTLPSAPKSAPTPRSRNPVIRVHPAAVQRRDVAAPIGSNRHPRAARRILRRHHSDRAFSRSSPISR